MTGYTSNLRKQCLIPDNPFAGAEILTAVTEEYYPLECKAKTLVEAH
jgi:hypothetical protein